MSDSRVILHVGWPKTATTSMQAELAGYPNLAGKPFGHPMTARAVPTIDAIVRARNWHPDDLDALVEAVRRDRNLPVLLSDEVLIAMPQREWFDNLVGPFEVANRLAAARGDKRVFFTLREPRRQLRSTWLHHVREGRTQTYPQFLDRVTRDRSEPRGTFAIAALVDRYADLFGVDNLAVGFTEDYTKSPIDFWRRFGEAFAIDGMETYVDCTGPRLNETVLGPVPYELVVNRIIGTYGKLRRVDDVRPMRRWMTRKVSRRMTANHEKFFARHATAEDELVAALQDDITRIRGLIKLI